jgi:hypothetical protein
MFLTKMEADKVASLSDDQYYAFLLRYLRIVKEQMKS